MPFLTQAFGKRRHFTDAKFECTIFCLSFSKTKPHVGVNAKTTSRHYHGHDTVTEAVDTQCRFFESWQKLSLEKPRSTIRGGKDEHCFSYCFSWSPSSLCFSLSIPLSLSWGEREGGGGEMKAPERVHVDLTLRLQETGDTVPITDKKKNNKNAVSFPLHSLLCLPQTERGKGSTPPRLAPPWDKNRSNEGVVWWSPKKLRT